MAEGTRLLVVEDDDDTREVLREVLAEDGYAVTVARDGLDALTLLWLSTQPVVVLLDQRMAPLAGTDVLAAVVASPQLATGRAFILLTSSPRGVALPPGTEAVLGGPVPLVEKPFDVDGLLAVVATAAQRLPQHTPIAG
jgi:CheY-like chemotaxis protein